MIGPNMDLDYCLQKVIIKQKLLPIYRKTALPVTKWNKANLQNPIQLKQNRTQLYNKGKAVPLQAWSGPEGSRKLRIPDFMTTAQEGGKVVSLRHRPHLLPGNPPGTHFC